jgi:hypothetical protein
MIDQRGSDTEGTSQGLLSLDIGIPELTIRRAIAWVQVDPDRAPSFRMVGDSHWEVVFPEGHDSGELQTFMRTLNEFRIRELIDDKTGALRKKIVHAALQAVWKPSDKR